MFSNLSNNLQKIAKNLRGQGRLTEDNIKSTLREIRIALLEADVALSVTKNFIADIKIKALGEEVQISLSPGQTLIKIVSDELTSILGKACSPLDLQSSSPIIILLAGLQGSGKTTTAAKLAHLLQTQKKRNVLLSSTDIYRPAAIQQLQILAKDINSNFYLANEKQSPEKIIKSTIAEAENKNCDTIIIDTAGRLHLDKKMMKEIQQIYKTANPHETLFVIDSMAGQDAINTVKTFNETIPLTGTILTKSDGDARGGVALSIWQTINKPIKFIGTGEKMDDIEIFHPDRIASRILGMGDILSLVEEVKDKIDKKEAEKLSKKIKKNKQFDLNDFLNQLEQMSQLGGITKLLGKLPGMGQLPNGATSKLNDETFIKMKAIIQSMTLKERRFPANINGSRKRRISSGSGTTIQDINRLLKQFTQMQKMMKKLSKKGGLKQMMRQMQSIMPTNGMGFPTSKMHSYDFLTKNNQSIDDHEE